MATDEQEMREQARVVGFSEWLVESIAVIAAADRDAEREQCCRDVCGACANPDKWEAAICTNGVWQHHSKMSTNMWDCDAEGIRSRVAAKEKRA